MNRAARLVAGLVLVLHVTPSWAAGPPNPTASDAHFNTAGGTNALANVDNPTGAGGMNNTAFGFEALRTNTTGFSNTAIGSGALFGNSTGIDNTAVGNNALNSNTIGGTNTASGTNALLNNTTGSSNTASGVFALENNNGNSNTASGVFALFSNTNGGGNTASGVSALQLNTTGNHNTAIGFKALNLSTGTKNIGIGFQAGVTLQTGNNNIYLGNQGVNSSEFQTMRLGSTQTSTFIAGIANTSVANDAVVVIDTATGQLGTAAPSSARYKQDITPMGSQSAGVLQLRPVTFAYKEDVRHVKRYGLVAEEVATVYPELVTRTATGEVQGVRYQELIPMLLNELQRQRQEFQQALQTQAQELAQLRTLVGQGREMAASSR